MTINPQRVYPLNDRPLNSGKVLYWMSRNQRTLDNWGLLFAQEISENEVEVVFNLVPEYSGAPWRHYDFMLKGLQEVEKNLKEKNIPFKILRSDSVINIPKFLQKGNFSAMVVDFDPLKTKKHWIRETLKKIDLPVFEVDATNIVPCRIASEKQEYAAYTLRPKIHRNLHEFLTEFPSLKKQKPTQLYKNDWRQIQNTIKADAVVKQVDWILPGEKAAEKALIEFINEKLEHYADRRNDPNLEATSNLSVYLHFGQIASQRIALNIINSEAAQAAKEAFLEELIVRSELADNFCHYNENYDNHEGFSDWAKQSIRAHERDLREYVYSPHTFEKAKTHDNLWNAAQTQLILTGKIHGYMRMYWAKKILEWSHNVSEAMKIAIYLNDKYALDGRDPRGYTGIAWSIGGIHDRAWPEREVFGKIRYMNYNGCKRKFDVPAYIQKFLG